MENNYGFIYVASKNSLYYGFAIQACKSLKQAYPLANVTLFTHAGFVTDDADIFDNIVTGIPVHERAKMWAMARSPYDITVYIDVDSQVVHPDVCKLFGMLGDKDYLYTQSPVYTVADFRYAYIDKEMTIVPPLNGSFLVYRKSDLMTQLLETWFSEYVKQQNSNWNFDFAHSEWQRFDMFTIWRLLFCNKDEYPSAYDSNFEKFRALRGELLNSRWNGPVALRSVEYNGPIVMTQIDKNCYEVLCPEMFNDVQQIIKECDVEDGTFEQSEVAGFTIEIR
tara:strand:+ start:285 stop:1124 length:840 start_codon:yes stop_codon:yes gene_type:complete